MLRFGPLLETDIHGKIFRSLTSFNVVSDFCVTQLLISFEDNEVHLITFVIFLLY